MATARSWVGEPQVPGTTAERGFTAVAACGYHSLALKADGSIVAWGENEYGQCSVPAPNTDFVAVATGGAHSLGLKANGSIVAWGSSYGGQCNVPAPNTDFVAVAAGEYAQSGAEGRWLDRGLWV